MLETIAEILETSENSSLFLYFEQAKNFSEETLSEKVTFERLVSDITDRSWEPNGSSVEIVDGYRSYRNNHHYYNGPGGGLEDWEWWQIALLCVGLIFLCCFVAICGQLFCSTECQEEMCCGESLDSCLNHSFPISYHYINHFRVDIK